MVTARSRRPSSSTALDHSPSRFVRRRSTVDPSSVLVRGLPLPNFQIVREFYANFPDVSAASTALFGLAVHERGISIPLSFHFISAALGLAPIRSGNSCEPVPYFLPCHRLVNRLYVSTPELVIEQSASVEFYIRESLIASGAANATVPIASLVLPRIIIALAAHASVHALFTDDIGYSDTIKVNNQVTLHLSDAHCTSGGFSIEQRALLDLLSTSHQVMHALLHCIWDRLDTYDELLLTLAGHIQPPDPPHLTRAHSL
ncbi:unnamed protein product [Prunus armeniaca]|uniref:Uncharacterized protein n=1 Tax=Prunus armeniaca TaxID=36596 RepID=A0A6J5U1A2_PRUAR|nr:unnamed protein product [Prunus armeniaca]CAB4299337.1 unnamed protein product [Prunus armeniaca]